MPEAKARRVKEQSRCGLQRRLRRVEIAAQNRMTNLVHVDA